MGGIKLETWIAIWLLVNMAGIGLYDIWATFQGNGYSTVSSVIYQWCSRWPLLAAMIGGLAIHMLGLGPRPK